MKISNLLGALGPPEDLNFCEKANEAALEFARGHAMQRSLDRYASKEPCNGCSPAVQMVFESDADGGGDFATFANTSLVYSFGDDVAYVQSPHFLSGDEHSCMLLSPSRALDFLTLDAFSANCYPVQSESIV